MATAPPPELLRAWFPWLQPFVTRFNFAAMELSGRARVTSWYRAPLANRRAGGDAESQHLFALAVDVQLLEGPGQVADFVRSLRRQGLIAVEESSHVHVQAFPAGALRRAGVTFPT